MATIPIAADVSKTFAAGGLRERSPAVAQWLRRRAWDKSFHTYNDPFGKCSKGFGARANPWWDGGGEDVMDNPAGRRRGG
jgi:hypothetical protein